MKQRRRATRKPRRRHTGQGRKPGGIGYPGIKRTTTNNIPNYVEDVLESAEKRLGVASQTCLTVYAIRKAKLDTVSLDEIRQDIDQAHRNSTRNRKDK